MKEELDKIKRVAVVGLGKMGTLHASLLNTIPGARVVAFCEKKPIIRHFAGKIFKGIDIVGEVEQLADLRLDAVYVTTPASAHSPVIKEVYSRGIAKNIFVEKPLTTSGVQSTELKDLANDQSITMVGYNRRFTTTFRRTKSILEEGTLGDLVSFDAYAYSSDLVGVRPGSNVTGGSVLRDLGCHAIDLVLWFFSDLQVEQAGTESSPSDGYSNRVFFTLKNSSGLNGKIESSWYIKDYRLPEIGLIIRGTKGTLTVNDDRLELKMNDGNSFVLYRHDLGDNVGFFLGRSDYFREDEAFIGAIANGSKIEPNFQTASNVDSIISQVEEKIAR
jgi:predicted dehydrogenase